MLFVTNVHLFSCKPGASTTYAFLFVPVAKAAPSEATPAMDWGGISAIVGEGSMAEPNTTTTSDENGCNQVDDRLEKLAETRRRLLNKYRCLSRRQQVKLARLESARSEVTLEEAMHCLSKSLPKGVYDFMESQVKAARRKERGKRYDNQEVLYSLALYYQSPRAYRLLRKRFTLPSPRVLRRRMQLIQMEPGFQDSVIAILAEKLRQTPEADRMVVLSFDEIQLRTKLSYLPASDRVEGVEDFGAMGKTSRLADHALTFMVRGLSQRWKQPIGYFFSAGPATAGVLETQLKRCIAQLRDAGLRVVTCVCDMGKTNQELYRKKLNVTVDQPWFEVDGQRVIAMYDMPHLVKCIRNCLHKHDVDVDGSTMSWSHVRKFYDADSRRPLRTAPKLRRVHIDPGSFKKMKVKYAMQVFSNSVARGMQLYSEFGKLGNVTDKSQGLYTYNRNVILMAHCSLYGVRWAMINGIFNYVIYTAV